MKVPELIEIGEKYGKTAVQVSLRWLVQKEIIAIPKFINKERIQANGNIFDFALTEAEMTLIDSLDRNERLGPDPNHFGF